MSRCIGWLLLLILASGGVHAQISQAFSYQGVLRQGGNLASGSFDFNVQLFGVASGGSGLNPENTVQDVAVVNGVFTLTLDFGLASDTFQSRWIEIRVREGTSNGPFTTLAPRQKLQSVPFAYHADLAVGAYWDGLRDVPAGFADGTDDGSVTQINSGAGLSGGPISGTGTLSIAPLGVQTSMLANDAVDATKVNRAQVQLRLSANCASGSYMRGISELGVPVCEALPRGFSRTVLPGDANGNIEVAIGNDGLPVIAYVDSGSDDPFVVKCARSDCSGPGNQVRNVNPVGGVGSSTDSIDLIVPPDGNPMLVYYEGSQQDLAYVRCGDPACATTAAVATLSATGNVGQNPSLALTVSGSPMVAFLGQSPNRLLYVGCPNINCSGSLVLTALAAAPVVSASPVLLLSSGLPTVLFHDSAADDLYSVRCTNSLCNAGAATTNLLSAGSAGGSTAAVLAGAAPTIAWRDAGSGNLRAARCLSAQCNALSSSFLIDGNPFASSLNSMALGSSGAPLIVGRSSAASELLVSSCGAEACNNGYNDITVLELGPVGSRPAVAVPSDGLPLIAYDQGSSIVVIKCGTRSCR